MRFLRSKANYRIYCVSTFLSMRHLLPFLLGACAMAAPLPPVHLSGLPLAFEPNQGQGDRSALFFARGGGYTIGLDGRGALIGMRQNNGSPGFVGIRFEGNTRQVRPVAERM